MSDNLGYEHAKTQLWVKVLLCILLKLPILAIGLKKNNRGTQERSKIYYF